VLTKSYILYAYGIQLYIQLCLKRLKLYEDISRPEIFDDCQITSSEQIYNIWNKKSLSADKFSNKIDIVQDKNGCM